MLYNVDSARNLTSIAAPGGVQPASARASVRECHVGRGQRAGRGQREWANSLLGAGCKQGLCVWVDGKIVATSPTLKKLELKLP